MNQATARFFGRSGPGDVGLPIGAHLVTPRWAYAHHGIYVGDNRVVHYAGLSRALCRGPVEEVSLEHFAAGRNVSIKPNARARFSPEQAVARARSRLGEDSYRMASNNCEHLCEWCVSGESRSEQVDRLVGWAHAAARAVRHFRKVFGAGVNMRPGPSHG